MELLAQQREQGRYKSTWNTRTEELEPPTLVDEEEGRKTSFIKIPSEISATSISTSVTQCFTPPNESIQEGRGSSESESRESHVGTNRKKSQRDIMTGKELADLENVEAMMLEAMQIKEIERMIKNETDGESQWFRASMELDTLSMDSSSNESNKMTNHEQEQAAENKTTLAVSYKYKPIHLFFKRKGSNEDRVVIEPHILTTTEEAMCSDEKEDVSTIEMSPMISYCTQQLLNTLNKNMKNENERSNNCFGIMRLICDRLQMILKTGAAIELQTLLRRCTYPKRDVIRWNTK